MAPGANEWGWEGQSSLPAVQAAVVMVLSREESAFLDGFSLRPGCQKGKCKVSQTLFVSEHKAPEF